MPFSNGKFGDAKDTLSGVTQLEIFDPYKENHFQTMAWQGGVKVYGLGDTVN